MDRYLSPQQGLTENINLIDSRLRSLRESMLANTNRWRVDAVYHIPYRNTIKVETDEAVVTALTGAEAYKHAAHALTSIHIELSEQSQRETLRAPGLVALPADWLAELRELNTIKSLIKDLSGQITEQRARSEFWAKFKGLSALQVIRQPWIVGEPDYVRFYWDTSPSMKTKQAHVWISEFEGVLTDYYGYLPSAFDIEGDELCRYALALRDLEAAGVAPNEKIAQYRDGKPHVRARIELAEPMIKDGQPTKTKLIRPVSVPIVYSITHRAPTIKPLASLEKITRRPGNTRTKIEVVPLNEVLKLHRYKPEHRFD